MLHVCDSAAVRRESGESTGSQTKKPGAEPALQKPAKTQNAATQTNLRMLTASLLRQASRAHALMGSRRGMAGINLQDLAAAAALDAKQQGKRGAGGAGGAGPRLPYLAIIPRTNIELEDPTLPPRPPARRPYPVIDPLTTTGKPAEPRTLPAVLRTQFTTGTAMFARDRMHLVPVTLLGGTPARKGHNPLHLMLDRRDVERELKEAGVFARQFKFDIQADPGVTTPAQLSAVRAAELHTTATLRTVDMHPVEHACLSAVFGRFVPGKNVVIKVPIKFVNAGACVGVKKGGCAF
jgi:hypothetical protein